MTVANLRAELEEELSWRLDEMCFFRNRLADMEDDDSRERYCKCLVVMLYAHFEGFWKAAFSMYLGFINKEEIPCRDAADHIVAASMNGLFCALADFNRKCDFFRRSAPDDTKLHQLARHAEFAGRISDVLDETVNVPIDAIVDTESNLKPVVVRKGLFRLGFSHRELESEEGTISELVRRRNDIAHGSARKGVSVDDYSSLESAVVSVMKHVVVLIFESLRERRFMRTATRAST